MIVPASDPIKWKEETRARVVNKLNNNTTSKEWNSLFTDAYNSYTKQIHMTRKHEEGFIGFCFATIVYIWIITYDIWMFLMEVDVFSQVLLFRHVLISTLRPLGVVTGGSKQIIDSKN